jgi:hypothetical protein
MDVTPICFAGERSYRTPRTSSGIDISTLSKNLSSSGFESQILTIVSLEAHYKIFESFFAIGICDFRTQRRHRKSLSLIQKTLINGAIF